MKKYYIFVLELEQNKYYLGFTIYNYFNFNHHFNSKEIRWTNKYRPIRLLELIYNCDTFDLDKYTIMYMSSYGIDNVRGGSFTDFELSGDTINVLRKMISVSQNTCYLCKSKNHNYKYCHLNFDDEDFSQIKNKNKNNKFKIFLNDIHNFLFGENELDNEIELNVLN